MEQYIENRREQALMAIGMIQPSSDGPKVASRSLSATSKTASVTDASKFLGNVGGIFNILKKTKISKVFQGLGLVLGCVDFFMTLLNPGQPDPTHELIKECFDRMMEQLGELSKQVDEVKREVQWSSVKNALGESETNIRNALEKYNDLQTKIGTSYEDEYMTDFLNFCNNINLENCMKTLTSAFTDRATAFGVRNLPEWAIGNTNHHYALMKKLFTVVCHLLLPAMHMYLFTVSSKGLDLAFESDQWAKSINMVMVACEQSLQQVVDSLPTYIENDFNTYYTQRGFGNRNNTWWSFMLISRDTHDFFKAKYPFANFAVVAYTPMSGGHHHWIHYYRRISGLYLHMGNTGINVHILWEKSKETYDRYIYWLSKGNNSQKLENDIQSLKNWLNSHTAGDAKTIRNSCPDDTSGVRTYWAFIVPGSPIEYYNSTYKSSLTKFSTHQVKGTANTNTNWTFVFQRYFGKEYYY